MDGKSKNQSRRERVVRELERIAFSNAADFARIVTRTVTAQEPDPETGETRPVQRLEQQLEYRDTGEVPRARRAAIADMRAGKQGLEVRLCDKMKALELLIRQLDLQEEAEPGAGETPAPGPLAELTEEELKKLAEE